MTAIQLENVGKQFKDTWVLRNVNLTFEAGKIHGLVGRNGSGKTLLMKLILGMSSLSEGTITVQGKRIGVDVDMPESVGAIIEVPGFLANLSSYENLKYLASLRKIISDDTVREAIRAVGLNPADRKRVGKYSLGMRQRLGIAQAIMENPDILILDEPMNGLDNRGVADVKALLKSLRETGKTILLASHHKEDIDELCDTVYKLEDV